MLIPGRHALSSSYINLVTFNKNTINNLHSLILSSLHPFWRFNTENCSPYLWRLLCVFLLHIYILFIYLFLAALSLHCCTQAFSSCSERGLTLCCSVWASHCGGFSCGAWALGTRASVVVALGLSSCGARA